MTPFEQARENISKLADGLAMMGLLAKTIEETEGLDEPESEIAWAVILSMLEATGRLGDVN